MIFARRTRLPLGIDVDCDVSIVALDIDAGKLVVRTAHSRTLPSVANAERERAVVETLRSLRAELELVERRCIISAPCWETQTRLFRPPPGMRRSETERAAMLEADSFTSWPRRDRVIALDPIPNAPELLLSVARAASVERATRLMRLSGFLPVAVDVPSCVWRRAAPETNALLDLRTKPPVLYVFGEPLGTVERLQDASDDRIVAQIRAALIQARRDGLADVERVSTVGPPERARAIEEALASDGYKAGPLTIGAVESPPWAFAFGLATWSVLPREGAA